MVSPDRVTQLMYYRLAHVNTSWKINETMGIRIFYATVMRSRGVSFLVFVSNLSGPDDVFLSIRGANLGWITTPNTLKIDTRHCNPMTFF